MENLWWTPKHPNDIIKEKEIVGKLKKM